MADPLMMPGNRRRFEQLLEAALNLGMSESDARFYADKVLIEELQHGSYQVTTHTPINGLY